MNDHPPPTMSASGPDPAELARLELASAYLDHQVDTAQRAQVEASPQLMGLVQSLRHVSILLGDPAPVADHTRQQTLAAALAEFDALPAQPSNVVPIASRARWSRVLTAAAAVLVVGVISVAAVNGLRGNNTKSSMAVPKAGNTTQSAATPGGTAAAGGESTQGNTTPVSTIGSIGGPASARVQIDSSAQLLSVADQYATTGTDTVPTADAGVTPSTTGVGQASAGSASTPPFSRSSTRPSIACALQAHQVVVALISFQGTNAAAVRDTSTGVVVALDVHCNVLATAHP
ncbi:MAG: hypothetical protein WCI22_12095 [Actinomycetota bacterium]